jgi:cephalosporin hydroxylase
MQENLTKIIDLFNFNKYRRTDISEHLPVLYELAKECEHITEFGIRYGISTSAFLAAQPKVLESYDIYITDEAHELLLLSIGTKTDFKLIEKSTLSVEINPTDMLFIDTLHTYDQVKRELELHGNKARRYLVFHDTELFGNIDEYNTMSPKQGICPAINDFIKDNPHWKQKMHFQNNCGLTVYEREQ